VVIGPERVARGSSEIKAMSERNFMIIPPGSDFQVTQKVVTENMAYIVWTAESERVKVPFGTDTFFMEKGKIVAQSFACQVIRKA
jgi:hypothetical protein